MKPINEYNFREIVGHFIKIKTDDNKYIIGYCYIDTQCGMCIKCYGIVADDKMTILPFGLTTIRCTVDMVVEVYDDVTEDMNKLANAVEESYTPDWIVAVRNNKNLDPYRAKFFVDDLLIPVGTYVDGEIRFESLWVRPFSVDDDILYGKTIESGNDVDGDIDIAIMDRSSLGKLFEEVSDVLGFDQSLMTFLKESIPKEEIDED